MAYLDAHIDAAACFVHNIDFQIAVFKLRVAQAESEGQSAVRSPSMYSGAPLGSME